MLTELQQAREERVRRVRKTHRRCDGYDPCEFEDGSRVKWVRVLGAVPPASVRHPYWVCLLNRFAPPPNCPYPARYCRPRQEVEPMCLRERAEG